MARPSRFTSQNFVDAAIALVAEDGAAAATLAAIARKAGGPTGSIYHRFASRAEIFATAWAAIHRDFATLIKTALNEGSGLLAALAIVDWARRAPVRARFLLLNDPGALIGGAPPAALEQEIERQERELEDAFQLYVHHAAGRDRMPDAEATARARFLVFDAPIALIRPHLAAAGAIPGFVDAIIREMHASVPVVWMRAS